MHVHYAYEKGDGTLNEDNYIIKDTLFGVFDGATSYDKYIDEEGKTGGFLASSIAKEAFEKDDASLKELAQKANKSIMEEMVRRDINVKRKLNLWSTTAAVIKIQNNTMHWVQIGDCLILVVYKDNSFKLLVEDDEHDKENLILWKRMADEGLDNLKERITPGIIKVRERMNLDYGFMSGEEAMGKFLNEGSMDLKGVKHVLLFTDGIFPPKKDPSQGTEFGHFVKLYREGGLENVKDYVRALEKQDPECRVYPRFKRHDDIAAISVTLDE